MIEIIEATLEDLIQVRSIALQTWPKTFSNILTLDQIEYMLNWMYSPKALESQVLEKQHVFLLAKEEGKYLGFCSYEVHSKEGMKTKIHKIYILPETQGKGVGKKLIGQVEQIAKANGDKYLFLNVNKYNQSAIDFYGHLGFYEAYREVIDIGNGFVMDDVVMEKKLD
ncbi:GNAT family N-acetyltransferase [Shivajiella indica]|uniref:GNAT family N-acetyltransferase n=1 Tax=Shivajiella indica TaxID=872115 RepID=A0ABW5B578_9BACT